jgi:hypothetical protein
MGYGKPAEIVMIVFMKYELQQYLLKMRRKARSENDFTGRI